MKLPTIALAFVSVAAGLSAESVKWAQYFRINNPNSPKFGCRITSKFSPWAYGGLQVENFTAIVIDYEAKDEPNTMEIDRCVAELWDSKETQQWFDDAVKYGCHAKQCRLWEIWVKHRLVVFLGWPERGK